MGLPTDLPVQVDEEHAEQFRLIGVQWVVQEYLSRLLVYQKPRRDTGKEDLVVFGRQALSMKQMKSMDGFWPIGLF